MCCNVLRRVCPGMMELLGSLLIVMLRESLPDRSVSLAIEQARMILNNRPDLNNREEKADLRKHLV